MAIVFFRIFEIKWFCLVVAIRDLVHDVEAIHGLPQLLTTFLKPFLSDSCETEVCEASNKHGHPSYLRRDFCKVFERASLIFDGCNVRMKTVFDWF